MNVPPNQIPLWRPETPDPVHVINHWTEYDYGTWADTVVAAVLGELGIQAADAARQLYERIVQDERQEDA